MTINTIKFSQFALGNYSDTTDIIVGATSGSGGGTNFQLPRIATWNTAGRPASPALATLGYNSDLGQYEFWNGASWVQLAAGGSGSVNLGSENQMAYYATTGTAVSGLDTANNAVLTTTSGGVPLMSTTLPAGLTIPQPLIVGVTDGSNAASGNVGEFVSSFVAYTSGVSLSNATAANITSISLTAGDWDVYGSVFVLQDPSSGITIAVCWSSTTSATLPAPGLYAGNEDSSGLSGNQPINAPFARVSISTTTTVYLSVYATFSSGPVTASGGIYARRVR